MLGVAVELGRTEALGGPVRRPVVLGVDELVQDAEERTSSELRVVHGAVEELRAQFVAVPGAVDQPVQGLRVVAHAEVEAEQLEPPDGQRVAVGEPYFVVPQVIHDPADPFDVLGVALVERLHLGAYSRIRLAVDVVGGRV